MARRYMTEAPLAAHHGLSGLELASPRRRLAAFALDLLLLFVPSVLVTLLFAAAALALTDPPAFRALAAFAQGEVSEGAEESERLADLAELLVRIEASGLPPELALAVKQGDRARAAQLLTDQSFVIGLSVGEQEASRAEGTVVVDLATLIPAGLRPLATFGVAALYFVVFSTGSRRATPGKRLFRLEVFRLDGEPLSAWQAFERFGGYLASLGTLGIGLLDFWRDPNRRLAHDRIAHTIVVRRARHA